MLPRLETAVALVFACLIPCGARADESSYDALDAAAVLVSVDQQPITKSDLEFELLWRRVPHEQQQAVRRQFMDELINRQLIREFLKQRRIDVPDDLLNQQLEQLRQIAVEGDFDEAITALGFTEETLRAHLELPLAWRIHLNRVVTDRQLQEFFEERRVQFDGSRVRASQIVIAMPGNATDVQWRLIEQTLQEIRRKIVDGDLEFAEAARRHSTSPSRENGGDLGTFAFHGKLPAALASVAFDLEAGEVSQPVRTEFGVHLLMTTERIPGDLSLEDVRSAVLDQFSRQLWDDEAQRLGEAADIEWRIDPHLLEPVDNRSR